MDTHHQLSPTESVGDVVLKKKNNKIIILLRIIVNQCAQPVTHRTHQDSIDSVFRSSLLGFAAASALSNIHLRTVEISFHLCGSCLCSAGGGARDQVQKNKQAQAQ
jgi:hypothetical protein